ncbi:MAG: DUF3301 domain-containing protein [Gammaproteobacteria bacterium]|nr:DUF3301 domain-containing protein [Gammaproteobacteria bacterium]NIM74892.1 DUF3301 domain-containing protein [Gammaproteobacteria bacterium]NIN39681.1 DUF3301 domain-containing protein [Gammaproteobacteria bacterium]NIO26809.1 DUF3301 domain-containing protein [Gammaproteobacteria bacterium]NIO67365.1 DUF3301 domain-containing protein [Gammaproteobacteria bacterium]
MWFAQEDLLILLAVIAGVLVFWRNTLRAREEAIRVSREACAHRGHQFLDDTVALARLGIVRGSPGWLQLRRTYEFEFSADGHDRRVGSITLSGFRVESVYLPEGAREF